MVVLVPVESTMLAAVGYDPHNYILTVLFNNGRAYDYFGVPPDEYAGLMASDSKGRYMHRRLLGVYPYAPFRGWHRRVQPRPARLRVNQPGRMVE